MYFTLYHFQCVWRFKFGDFGVKNKSTAAEVTSRWGLRFIMEEPLMNLVANSRQGNGRPGNTSHSIAIAT